jgi:hypothetical protein
MSNYVSPCCGENYEDSTKSYCCTAEISESGLCHECHDHAEAEGYICNECDEWFEEYETEYEYYQRKRDDYLEDKADAKRKYNE